MLDNSLLAAGIISLVILVFSAILHEIAHGWVAERLGDPTARLLGRLTLNPIPHIDPVMTIMVPLMLIFFQSPVIFGAAKPVPVDPFNLKDRRRDMALVALAGPMTNIIIAVIFAAVVRIVAPMGIDISLLIRIIELNILLAIFNLLPIPPLDGSKIFSLVLPEREAASYLSIGSMGMFILFFLLLFPIGGFSLGEFVFRLTLTAMGLLLGI